MRNIKWFVIVSAVWIALAGAALVYELDTKAIAFALIALTFAVLSLHER